MERDWTQGNREGSGKSKNWGGLFRTRNESSFFHCFAPKFDWGFLALQDNNKAQLFIKACFLTKKDTFDTDFPLFLSGLWNRQNIFNYFLLLAMLKECPLSSRQNEGKPHLSLKERICEHAAGPGRLKIAKPLAKIKKRTNLLGARLFVKNTMQQRFSHWSLFGDYGFQLSLYCKFSILETQVFVIQQTLCSLITLDTVTEMKGFLRFLLLLVLQCDVSSCCWGFRTQSGVVENFSLLLVKELIFSLSDEDSLVGEVVGGSFSLSQSKKCGCLLFQTC